MPQYQQAVEKTRAAEAFTTLSSMSKAVDYFWMKSPGVQPTFDKLYLNIPGTESAASYGSTAVTTKYFKYRSTFATSGGQMGTNPLISASRIVDGSTAFLIMQQPTSTKGACHNTCCWYKEKYEETCKSIGFTGKAGQSCATSSLGCAKFE